MAYAGLDDGTLEMLDAQAMADETDPDVREGMAGLQEMSQETAAMVAFFVQATGGPLEPGNILFRVGSSGYFRVRVRVTATNTVTIDVLAREIAPTLDRHVEPRVTSPYRLITIPATDKRVYVQWQGRP